MKGTLPQNRRLRLRNVICKLSTALALTCIVIFTTKAWLSSSPDIAPPIVDLDWIRSSYEVCSLSAGLLNMQMGCIIWLTQSIKSAYTHAHAQAERLAYC